MYARLQQDTGSAHGVDGASEVYGLHGLAATDGLVLSVWPTREEAAADRTAEWYVLEDVAPGGDRDARPEITALVSFDGPLSDPVHQAIQRANTERIGPSLVDHAGSVRALVLWQPERRAVLVVVLALSVEAIEDAQRVMLSTELLPGEDPALLREPDRVDLYRVSSLRVATPPRPTR